MRAIVRTGLAALCGLALSTAVVPPAQAAFDDPLFVFRPVSPSAVLPPSPPPLGHLEGPCGVAVDSGGNFYVSDYYHHAVDVFTSDPPLEYGWGYQAQIANEDPLDGPCGLAFDNSDNLYVNNYHRNVVKFEPAPVFGAGTVITGVGAGAESPYPTGVGVEEVTGTVYVNQRTHVSAFDSTGAEVGQFGSFGNGYGIAVSHGLVYVPDAATNTVLVFDPEAPDPDAPVAVIDGSGTPAGHFTSLRNSAIAVDEETGEVYVVDDLTPRYTSHHEGVVHVFTAAGTYEGRLKFSLDIALPAGLAVDNSGGSTQGRVFVTSGNSEKAAVYVYPPLAATTTAVPLPFLPLFDSGAPAPTPEAPISAAGAVTGSSSPDSAAGSAGLAPAVASASPRRALKAKGHRRAKRHAAHRRHKAARR